MNVQFQAPALPPKLRVALHLLAGIILLDYVAQIPYYMHFYGIYHRVPILLTFRQK